MENASKALIMAGGILIALLVIGALLLMINQIGSYSRSQDDNVKMSQLADFNLDFERYCDDKGINGADIISLINKVNDYNHKSVNNAVTNSVDYSIKITVKVSGFNEFNSKYAYDNGANALFGESYYEFGPSSITTTNTLYNRLKACANAATTTADKEKLKTLSATYDTKKNRNQNVEILQEKSKELKLDWNESIISLDTIRVYRQYCEFMTSKFIVADEPVYENGQISKMFFKFDK